MINRGIAGLLVLVALIVSGYMHGNWIARFVASTWVQRGAMLLIVGSMYWIVNRGVHTIRRGLTMMKGDS